MELKQISPLVSKLKSVSEFLEARGTKPDMEIRSLPTLNKKIWGIGRKKLTLVGARPSNGKSSFIGQIAWDISRDYNVLLISLEQTQEESIERMFCNVMKVDNLELLKGGFKMYQKQWKEFEEQCKERRLVLTEGIGKTWKEIDEALMRLAEFPDLVIMDYIQCVSTKGIHKLEIIDEYILHLRNLAIQNNFGVILCSQINRQNVEGLKEPTITGLKSSGFLEELSDKVLLLHWEAHSNHTADLNKFKIIIAKNKSGRTGSVDLTFEPQYYRFSDEHTEVEVEPETLLELKGVMDTFEGKIVGKERKDWNG